MFHTSFIKQGLYIIDQLIILYTSMRYHKGAFVGSERSRKAQMKLFDYAGFAMLTYTIKQGKTGFEPVGEEMLVGKITRGSEMMIFLCDNDGYAKAQSRLLSVAKGDEIYEKIIADGILEYKGQIKTVS